jgi:hypothetical protein
VNISLNSYWQDAFPGCRRAASSHLPFSRDRNQPVPAIAQRFAVSNDSSETPQLKPDDSIFFPDSGEMSGFSMADMKVRKRVKKFRAGSAIRKMKLSRCASYSGCLKVESIDLLAAGVAHEQR